MKSELTPASQPMPLMLAGLIVSCYKINLLLKQKASVFRDKTPFRQALFC